MFLKFNNIQALIIDQSTCSFQKNIYCIQSYRCFYISFFTILKIYKTVSIWEVWWADPWIPEIICEVIDVWCIFLGRGVKILFPLPRFLWSPKLNTNYCGWIFFKFGPSGFLLIFTCLFLELQLYSFPIFFPLHCKIKNFQESKWNALAFCVQTLSWIVWYTSLWRLKIKPLMTKDEIYEELHMWDIVT